MIMFDDIHNIFITDNFFIIDSKRSRTYKVYIPIPGDHFRQNDPFITCHIWKKGFWIDVT